MLCRLAVLSATTVNRFALRLPLTQRRLPPRFAAAGTAVMACLLGGCGWHDPHAGRTTPETAPAESTVHTRPAPADNTAINERDRQGDTTPFDQGDSAADIAITREIRKAVVADEHLSVNAQNVKIITRDGTVTLRGPVASENERATIGAIAQLAPGARSVINHLEVMQ